MAGGHPDWARCDHDGCIGARLPTITLCLAHAADQAPDAFSAELKRIRAEGTIDARGVVISIELLERLLAAAPRKANRPAFKVVRFAGTTFQGAARFVGVSFQSWAEFTGASFHDWAGFSEASFQGRTWFTGATFKGEATFGGASFHSRAGFTGASFQAGAWFNRSTFKSEATFGGVTFEGKADFTDVGFQGEAEFFRTSFQDEALFRRTAFNDEAIFALATFKREAEFPAVSFQAGAWFNGVTIQGDGRFNRASFQHASQFGPLLARQLVLDDAVFRTRVELEVTAAAICARRAQFLAGGHMRLRFASVVLDDASFSAPAILAGAPAPFLALDERKQRGASCWQRLPPGPREQRWRPRLLSICRADVAGLRLADVDLRACRFLGAHNLDQLRIEGAPLFARTAGWWRTRRKTLAEEQHWRVHRPSHRRPAGWYPRVCQPPASPKAETPGVPDPSRLAALYRELRKGREDAKDEPGAADFYYGECEMRRHDSSRPRAEQLVLWLYWVLSGYGLRAWRAMAALAVVVVLAGIVLAFWGFPSAAPSFRPAAVDPSGALVYQQRPADPPPGLGRLPDAIRFSARSATALLRGPDRALTPLGEWLEIGLRFVGPILLGLAVLSVRGRVRR
jgi:Pentapeptide repeats (9 copies)